jgi:cobyric acid synthase
VSEWILPQLQNLGSTLYDILAVAGREGTKLQGLALFDFWARGKHPKTVRRRRREVAKR